MQTFTSVRPHRSRLCPLWGFWLLCLASLQVSAQTEITVVGNAYTSLSSIASRLGMELTWLDRSGEDKKVRLKSEWTTLDFTLHQRSFDLNGIRVFLGNPVAERNGSLYISELDFQRTLAPILTPQIFNPVPRLRHIVIDPGHGGHDPGTQNTALKLQEKNLVMDLSRRIKTILEAEGFRVSLIRETDVYIAPAERAARANQMGADLFLSIHFNATTSASVSGIETFAYTPAFQPSTSRASLNSSDRRRYPANNMDPWNILLGFYIQRQLLADLQGNDRGLKRARFAALRDLECPGVLIEGGFLSNTREAKNIGWSAYRQRMAQSIADGVLTYHRALQRLQGS